jgi:hypothetical protein
MKVYYMILKKNMKICVLVNNDNVNVFSFELRSPENSSLSTDKSFDKFIVFSSTIIPENSSF